MEKKNHKITKWLIIIIVFSLILITFFKIKDMKNNKTESNTNNENNAFTSEEKVKLIEQITLTEELNIEDKIENLENVRCDRATLKQRDKKMQISINLTNTSKTEDVEARKLKVNLINKNNKVIYTKDVEIEKIEKGYKYTKLNIEFDLEEPVIVYKIELKADAE